jgi:hypothetical protein
MEVDTELNQLNSLATVYSVLFTMLFHSHSEIVHKLFGPKMATALFLHGFKSSIELQRLASIDGHMQLRYL